MSAPAQTTPPQETPSTPPAFDPVKFQSEINQRFIEQQQQIAQMIQTSVAAMSQGKENADESTKQVQPQVGSEDLNDYAAEVQALGLEGEQAQALVALIHKSIGKKVSGVKDEFKKEVKTEITTDQKYKTDKASYESEAIKKWPQILDQSSRLWQVTQKEYASLDPITLKSPMATSIAIQRAAEKLGIEPTSIASINSMDAQTATGNAGGNVKQDEGPSKEQVNFAASFNVKADKFAEKLKLVRARK